MKDRKIIKILVLLIVFISGFSAFFGIFEKSGPGEFYYESIRHENIKIYGQGVYKHMPSDVAIQGIAQDYVTLFIAIPLLLFFLFKFCRSNLLKYNYLLSGTIAYFFVTYLFYTAMGMYNSLFLCYVSLLGLSFFALFISMKKIKELKDFHFSRLRGGVFVSLFLIFNSLSIALLWLSIIVPPLLDGSIYPSELNHFTTLIVQGFDLGLLLPACIVSGFLLYKKRVDGYIYSTIYLVFLSFLMTALTAKIIAMANSGVNVFPVIFIIPTFNVITIISSYLMIKGIDEDKSAL